MNDFQKRGQERELESEEVLEVGELSDINKVKFSKARRNVMGEKKKKERKK